MFLQSPPLTLSLLLVRLNQGHADQALDDANHAVELDASYSKAYYRKGQVSHDDDDDDGLFDMYRGEDVIVVVVVVVVSSSSCCGVLTTTTTTTTSSSSFSSYQAHTALGDHEAAYAAFQQGIELEPDNKIFRTLAAKALDQIKVMRQE